MLLPSRLWRRVALTAVIVSASPAAARPFTVDDLLATEEFAQVLVDPSGRWLVIERRDAAGRSPRFDLETHAGFALGQLLVTDLNQPGLARPLVPREVGTAYVAYGFSPTGQRLAIARLRGRSWELGVVTLATGAVNWLGLAPVLVGTGRAIQWVSDNSFVVLAEREGALPTYLRAGWQAMHELPILWERAANGSGPTATAVGSGRFRDVTPAAAPNRLMQIDLRFSRRDILATGAFLDFEIAHDRRHVALLENAERLQAAAGETVGVGTAERRIRLYIGDLAQKSLVPVLSGLDVADTLLKWSPDSRRLLIFARKNGASWTDGEVFAVDAARHQAVALAVSGRRPAVAGPPNFPPVAAAGWLGDTPVVRTVAVGVSHTASPPQWYRFAGAGAGAALLGSANLGDAAASFDDRGGMWLQRGSHRWRVGSGARLTPEATAPAGSDRLPNSQSEAGLRGADWDGGRAASWSKVGLGRITAGTATRTLVTARVSAALTVRALALAHRALVIKTTTPGGTSQILVCATEMTCIPVSTINASLAAVEPARPVAIVGSDGLTSWLFLPPTDSRRPWPLVVIAYPDNVFGSKPPEGQAAGQPLDSISAQVLAGHGYAVLLPSLPRPQLPGRSADGLAEQLLAVVDRVAARPDIDGRRLALWGHSFGGYAAAVVVTQTTRFRAVIASAGLYDLVSAYGSFLPAARLHPEDGLSVNTMTGWVETGQPFVGAAPWQTPARYAAASPVFAADRIQTPMLLLQGDRDISALSQAEELFSALYRQNKDAVLVSYWGEGHVISSPPNLRDLYARVFDWFDRAFLPDVAGSAAASDPVTQP